jgi:uncharacterized protein YdaU (DUF1376 family)
MIDLYYTQEGPLSNDIDRLCRRIRVDVDKHGAVVRDLLNEFFKPTETGWVQERCERELSEYKDRAEIARQNGARGGRPRKNPENPAGLQQETQPVISGFPKITHEKANQNQNHIKEAADAADTTIWDLGIKFLKTKGVPEKQARTILGSHYKADKEKLASVVAQMLTIKPIEPIAYLQKAMQPEVRRVAI